MSDKCTPDRTHPSLETTRRTSTRGVGSRSVAVVASVALLLAACGSDGETSADSTGTTDAEVTTTVDDADDSERTIVTADGAADGGTATTETEAAPTTTEEAEPTTTEGDDGVPGEPLDFGPAAGTPLAIVGVAYDDTLNFRDEPSPGAAVLESFAPLSDDLDTSALGEAWAAPSGVWWKVNVAGTEAWANQAYLGSLGTPYDAFDDVASELGILKFETVEAAGLAVADTRVSDDPESRVVFAGEPLAFDIGGFAIIDVLDLGDDAVKGERIRINVEIVFDEESGEEGAQDVAFVVLTGVEISPICGRGVSGGLCL